MPKLTTQIPLRIEPELLEQLEAATIITNESRQGFIMRLVRAEIRRIGTELISKTANKRP